MKLDNLKDQIKRDSSAEIIIKQNEEKSKN